MLPKATRCNIRSGSDPRREYQKETASVKGNRRNIEKGRQRKEGTGLAENVSDKNKVRKGRGTENFRKGYENIGN